MHKFAALALVAALGIAGMGYAKPAEARVYVGVGIGLPGVAVVAPPVVAYAPPVAYGPYYYGRPYYYTTPTTIAPGTCATDTAFTAAATCTAAIGAKGGPCRR